jgi:hypothetical protein
MNGEIKVSCSNLIDGCVYARDSKVHRAIISQMNLLISCPKLDKPVRLTHHQLIYKLKKVSSERSSVEGESYKLFYYEGR